jgi:hypothetical protein
MQKLLFVSGHFAHMKQVVAETKPYQPQAQRPQGKKAEAKGKKVPKTTTGGSWISRSLPPED